MTTNHDAGCASLMTMAERELCAFMTAVTKLYGPEQARLAAQDWLDELESMDGLPRLASREWRLITLAAAARRAEQLIGISRQRNNPCHAEFYAKSIGAIMHQKARR